MEVLATGPEVGGRIVSEVGTSLAAAAEIATPSVAVREVPADTTARVLAPAAAVVARAWALAVEAEASEVVAGGAGKWLRLRGENDRSNRYVISLCESNSL